MEENIKIVSPDHVCRHFDRIPESLIEEPEVCEWCSYYCDGACRFEETK